MPEIADHDAYIEAAPEQFRALLRRLRDVLRDALPDAEEIVAYGMPGFRVTGTTVASYAAFSKQVGVYVLAPALTVHADEVAAAGLKASKTGVTFTPRRAPSDDLMARLARTSRSHAEA